jgi:hypothetical protein
VTALRSFAAFWYDFIVGDSWELAVGVLVTLLAVGLVDHFAPAGIGEAALPIAMPLMLVAVLGISLARADD